jgi:hypothetical protein
LNNNWCICWFSRIYCVNEIHGSRSKKNLLIVVYTNIQLSSDEQGLGGKTMQVKLSKIHFPITVLRKLCSWERWQSPEEPRDSAERSLRQLTIQLSLISHFKGRYFGVFVRYKLKLYGYRRLIFFFVTSLHCISNEFLLLNN